MAVVSYSLVGNSLCCMILPSKCFEANKCWSFEEVRSKEELRLAQKHNHRRGITTAMLEREVKTRQESPKEAR